MELIINDVLIDCSIETILKDIRKLTGGKYFKSISPSTSDNIKTNCPWHSDGQEEHPACFIVSSKDKPDIEYGFTHCFVCGAGGPIYNLVSHCLQLTEKEAKLWLVDKYGSSIVDYYKPIYLPEIEEQIIEYIPEVELEQYNAFHPYLVNRKVSIDVLKKFKIGYDRLEDSVVFPCWDVKGGLTSINKRSVKGKTYRLQGSKSKDVYLLNFVESAIKNKINFPFVVVVESQINALTLWSYGIPAVALMGTGSKRQYDILNACDVQTFVTCLDGDKAGWSGAYKFKKNVNQNKLVFDVKVPWGTDINDLSREQVEKLFCDNGFNWRVPIDIFNNL